MRRKFGWHSGILNCLDARVERDLHVQNDIVFSDVSAGKLGVTGGIDMDATTSAVGIAMGGTFATAGIDLDGTMATDAIVINANCAVGFHIADALTITDGILIESDCTDGIHLAGAFGAYGLHIGGVCTTAGIFLDGTNKLMFDDSAMYMRASADGHLEIVSDDTITLSSPGHGSIVFGGETDWGAGVTGHDIDGNGWDWCTQTVAHVDSGALAAACAASYNALTVNTTSHTTASSFFGTWTELYLIADCILTGSSNTAAVWGQVEALGAFTSPDSGDFVSAGYFNMISGGLITLTDGSSVNGLRVKGEVHSVSGTGIFAAIEVLATTTDWTYGLYLSNVTTDIRLHNGATIVNGSADVLTITEPTITLVASTAVTATTGTLNVQPAADGNAIINLKSDANAHLTITQTNGAGVTFLSTSDGTAGFLFDGGIITLDGGAILDNTTSAAILDITEATITLTGSTAIDLASDTIYIGATGAGYIGSADTATTIYGGDTGGDNLVLRANSSDTIVLTVDGATGLTLAGTVVTGLGISTASTSGIDINTSTPTQGILISAACGSHAINISAGQTGAGITIGSTCGTYGLDIVGACSTAGISLQGASASGILISGSCTTAGINFTGANLNCIKSVFNIGAQLGQYVQGIKMEHTRSADIQPSTGGWWGMQVVLNAGTGYTALDQPAYVIHGIFKGDATDPDTDCVNVARFETQSDGKVEDLLFVSANSGSTVTGDIARFVAHVAPTRAILGLQNGTTGSTPCALYIDADETMTTAITVDNGAVITNFLTISSTARGPFNSGSVATNTGGSNGHLVCSFGGATYKIPVFT